MKFLIKFQPQQLLTPECLAICRHKNDKKILRKKKLQKIIVEREKSIIEKSFINPRLKLHDMKKVLFHSKRFHWWACVVNSSSSPAMRSHNIKKKEKRSIFYDWLRKFHMRNVNKSKFWRKGEFSIKNFLNLLANTEGKELKFQGRWFWMQRENVNKKKYS